MIRLWISRIWFTFCLVAPFPSTKLCSKIITNKLCVHLMTETVWISMKIYWLDSGFATQDQFPISIANGNIYSEFIFVMKLYEKYTIFRYRFTPRYMYDRAIYPKYLSGSGYVFTIDAAAKLYNASLELPILHLEDVYLTGQTFWIKLFINLD